MHSSTRYLIIATILLLCGAAFPFLMVMRVIQPSLWLSFLSYGSSVIGLMLGMYGVTGTVIRRNQKNEWEDWRDL